MNRTLSATQILHKMKLNTTAKYPKVTRTVDGNSEMLSYTDSEGNFNALIQPRMATAEEINTAFSEIAKNNPDIVVGEFKGVAFHKVNK